MMSSSEKLSRGDIETAMLMIEDQFPGERYQIGDVMQAAQVLATNRLSCVFLAKKELRNLVDQGII